MANRVLHFGWDVPVHMAGIHDSCERVGGFLGASTRRRPSHGCKITEINILFFMKLKIVFMKTNQQVIEKDGAQKKNVEETHDNKAFDMSTNL